MLYYLFDYLEREFDLFGAGVFQYISFRAGLAAFLSLLITIFFGKRLIGFLRKRQVGEDIRDLGLEGQMQKKGTPTMGGLIIIGAILVPTILLARVDNVYVVLLVITTVWLGGLGFIDDYIKVFKKDKKGLAGKFKIVGQVGLGLVVGLILYFNGEVVIRELDAEALLVLGDQWHQVRASETLESISNSYHITLQELKAWNRMGASELAIGQIIWISPPHPDRNGKVISLDSIRNQIQYRDVKSTSTTVPFLKNNELDYGTIVPFLSNQFTWIIYVLVVIVIITAVSNGANITDGIDGLAAGTSGIIALTLAILAYLSGRVDFSNYLNIMYIPNLGELVVFCTAFVGACLGFLWYNSYPAQVFMGDTGSLTLGGVIAVLALAVRKELLIPILCGIFLIESVSVMLQVAYFKYTKRKYGEGRRIFLMSPLHHHYQKKGWHESKIVTRFWIVGILLAIAALATLKLR